MDLLGSVILFYFILFTFILSKILYTTYSLYIPVLYFNLSHVACILFISVVVIGELWYHVRMTDKTDNHIPEKLYTMSQLAEILQLTKNHLYILCRRGDIPYINVGFGKNKEYRFDLDEVKNKLKRGK